MTLSAPPTFSSLPHEMIRRIIHHVDRPSALALALVTRELTNYANDRLFRDLDFTVEPMFDGEPMDLFASRDGRVSELQLRRREALRMRIQAVSGAGSEKLRKVETIKTIIRTGSVEETVELLSCVSPNLESFWAEASDHDVGLLSGSEAGQWFDSAVLRYHQNLLAHGPGLSFPTLTTVKLGYTAVFYIEFIPLLCSIAPALTTLHCCLDDSHIPIVDDSGTSFPNFPRFLSGDTKIVNLAVDYGSYRAQLGLPYDSAETIFSLLERSPNLRNLSLAIYTSRDDTPARLLSQISKYTSLENLYWKSRIGEILTELSVEEQGDEKRFSAVQRVALGSDYWELPSAEIEDTLTFPSLEIVLLTCCAESEDISSTPFDPPSPMQPLDGGTAMWLRQRPRLHILHYQYHREEDEGLGNLAYLDKIEKSGNVNGRISSMRHGDGEVIHARFLLHYVSQVDDYDRDGRGRQWARVICPAGSDTEQPCRGHSEPAWQDMSDFEGRMVPMEVLEKVREMEDVGEDFDWDRRGVEVGEAAWEVLTNWRSGLSG